MQHSKWHDLIKKELPEHYFARINHFMDEVYQAGVVYPPREKVFNAIQTTPLEAVKVVIIGQDPYHGDPLRGRTACVHKPQEDTL